MANFSTKQKKLLADLFASDEFNTIEQTPAVGTDPVVEPVGESTESEGVVVSEETITKLTNAFEEQKTEIARLQKELGLLQNNATQSATEKTQSSLVKLETLLKGGK